MKKLNCDDCNHYLKDGDAVYCGSCWNLLEEKLLEAEKEIKKLKEAMK